ncbi:MAG: phosphonoacetaldehyde dehydrogenase [Hyphomicrobiaceae bacterium]|nr:phosphonoacetaldehyde dehydrogenase [Hyphomicrobiaceae bacterium]
MNIQARIGKRRHEPMRIAGRKVDTTDKVEVRYPYTNEVIGTVPAGTAEHAREAFEIAAAYRPTLTRYERQQILMKTGEAIWERRDEISDIITAELGISKKDSIYECGRARDVYNLCGQLCIIDDSQSFACDITHHGQARRIFTTREPLRAISAITPFNHPLNMVSHKLAPAIATNNCVVLKPTEKTPLTALVLADILYDCGLPPQMLSVVTGLPEMIGDEMITNPNVELVTFTGGVKVGKMIAEKAGYRRTILELGGNDPLIILDDLSDAEIDKAATLAVGGATKNSGQRCTAVKRILVLESVADKLVARILEKAKKIRFGDPMDPETDLGTVVDEEAAALIDGRIKKAEQAGAKVLYHPGRKGALLPPVVIDHVRQEMELVMEESFGPAIPIIRCPNIDELIKTSNSTAFGLSSGVCTNRLDHAQRIINELNVGTVNIWEVPGYRTEMSPFGGIKDSGTGYKEGVLESMRSYTNVKTFSMPWQGR